MRRFLTSLPPLWPTPCLQHGWILGLRHEQAVAVAVKCELCRARAREVGAR